MEQLREAEAERGGREGTPAVVLTETGGAILADGERGQQQVLPVVVDFTEERSQAITELGTAVVHCAGGCIRPHIVYIFQGIALRVSREVDDTLLGELTTQKDVEVMVGTQGEEIVGCVGPYPVGLVVVGECRLGDVVANHVRLVGVGQRIDERCLVVDTEVGLQREAFDRLQLYVGVSKYSPVVEMVVAVIILLAGRVLTVGHGANWTGKGLSVFLIYRYDRRHLQRVLHRSTVHLRGIGDREVLTHCKHLVEIPGSVQPGCNVLEAGVFQDTVHILIAKREHSAVLVVGV